MTRIFSAAVVGIEAAIVEVEADILPSLPSFSIVGLPDTAIQEARERIKSAIKNSGALFPRTKVTINLAPAHLPKNGPLYDLPMAVAILSAAKYIPTPSNKTLFVGELSLDGRVRPVQGMLPIALSARAHGFTGIVIPEENKAEAELVRGLTLYPVQTLNQTIAHYKNIQAIPSFVASGVPPQVTTPGNVINLADIKGNAAAKRALEIACAGHHNVLMVGPPGSGKTMLARAIPGILPPLSEAEMISVTQIYSVVQGGNFKPVLHRPFRAPHHTISHIALVGGGSVPQPGEVSLSHHGVLFLDEFPEFSRLSRDGLRQPIEDGFVTVSRAAHKITFPAQCMVVAAMNPCPCGYATDQSKDCVCTPGNIAKYTQRISGPILDRIDLTLEVPRIPYKELQQTSVAENSQTVQQRVINARNRQHKRQGKPNSGLTTHEVQKFCILKEAPKTFLRNAAERLQLSARSYFRVIKVGRTIADLAGNEEIEREHLAEALRYRYTFEKQ